MNDLILITFFEFSLKSYVFLILLNFSNKIFFWSDLPGRRAIIVEEQHCLPPYIVLMYCMGKEKWCNALLNVFFFKFLKVDKKWQHRTDTPINFNIGLRGSTWGGGRMGLKIDMGGVLHKMKWHPTQSQTSIQWVLQKIFT